MDSGDWNPCNEARASAAAWVCGRKPLGVANNSKKATLVGTKIQKILFRHKE